MTLAPARVTVRLEGEATIYRAAELKEQLLGAIAPGQRLEVDLAEVSEIDTCGVQLLLLAQRSVLAEGGELVVTGRSDAVGEVFELLRLSAHFPPMPAAHESRSLG